MNRYRMQFAPAVWKPKLNPLVVRLFRPFRLRHQQNSQRLMQLQVTGKEPVQQLLKQGCGVMVMPNHSSHADPFTIYAAADEVGTPLHIMATWHVFHDKSWVTRWLLRNHGCFSVDREANDIGAFRQAIEILEKRPEPLVIFPEGEIYHCNDRVTPFREGASAIAIAAARRADRPIYCVPCAITYSYLSDPTPDLIQAMGDLEEAILWKRQHDRPLPERIYRFAEALLAVKELEYFRQTKQGSLPVRIRELGQHILQSVETKHEIKMADQGLPERVKAARRTILEKTEACRENPDTTLLSSLSDDLDELFLVVQTFSYPGDYVIELPSIERLAETIDKFEEDILRRPTASIRGERAAVVQFGEPVAIPKDRKQKNLATEITRQVESEVQRLLASRL